MQTRYFSGLLEVLLAKEVGDRTAWQTMLKGNGADQDLEHIRQQLMSSCAQGIADLQLQHGEAALSYWRTPGDPDQLPGAELAREGEGT